MKGYFPATAIAVANGGARYGPTPPRVHTMEQNTIETLEPNLLSAVTNLSTETEQSTPVLWDHGLRPRLIQGTVAQDANRADLPFRWPAGPPLHSCRCPDGAGPWSNKS
jgi:hypothetical protein